MTPLFVEEGIENSSNSHSNHPNPSDKNNSYTPDQDPPETSRLVQMRLQPRTLQRLSKLAEMTGVDNRTQIVAASIQLTEELFSNIKKGGKLYIENSDGTKEHIKILGLGL